MSNLDSRAVADHIGTDPKTLRRFLRSSASSMKPVGSSNRYVFTTADLPTVIAEFAVWASTAPVRPVVTPARPKPRQKPSQDARDAAVWAEEGDVVLEDLRDPRVRRAVRARARAEEAHLYEMMRNAGLVAQGRERVPVSVG